MLVFEPKTFPVPVKSSGSPWTLFAGSLSFLHPGFYRGSGRNQTLLKEFPVLSFALKIRMLQQFRGRWSLRRVFLKAFADHFSAK